MWRLLAVVLTLLVAGPAMASRSVGGQPVDLTDEMMGRYNLHPLVNKLARGTSNLVGGWLEVPLNVQKRYDENDTVVSLLTGTGIGMVKGVVRTGVGLFEMLTFWLPYPPRYGPILPTLEYYKRKRPRRELLLE